MKDIVPRPKKATPRKNWVLQEKTQAILAPSEKPPVKISWEAHEYEYRPKSADWFWIVVIATLALFGLSLMLHNFLFSISVVLFGFVILLYGAKKPRLISFSISPRGIIIGKRLYVYGDLKSFWIYYDPPRKKELSVRSKKTLVPTITIPLEKTDPNEIRAILVRFLKEEQQEESLLDTISDALKF